MTPLKLPIAAVGNNKSILQSPRNSLVIFRFKVSKRTYWLHSKPISNVSEYDLLTNTELRVVFPRWPSIDFKPTGSSHFKSINFNSLEFIAPRQRILIYIIVTQFFTIASFFADLFSLKTFEIYVWIIIYKIFIVPITKKILKIIFVDGHGVRHNAIKTYNDKIQMSIAP